MPFALLLVTFSTILGLPGESAMPTQTAHLASLQPCHVRGIDVEVRCGVLRVFENRDTRRGRTLDLKVIILPPRHEPRAPDPVVSLYGGPGQAATDYAADEWTRWYRDHREVILVDQRGTGGSNALDCQLSGTEDNVQGYMEPMFQPALFQLCRERLERIADLALYSTPIAMDDLDELRKILGYEKINLYGGSYGSRAALTYIQRHPAHVRSAILFGVAPFSIKNPLYHAKSAQEALDRIFSACDDQPDCRAAFPGLRLEFLTILRRLDASPVDVVVPHPSDGKPVRIRIGRPEFAEAMRVMTYDPDTVAALPLTIHSAFSGDLVPFGREGLASNYWLRHLLRYGMLMSTTCSEDVARISEADIVSQTAGTFLGDSRVRQEIESCKKWPMANLTTDFDKPRRTTTPALIISGFYDPVTPPHFGEEVLRDYLPKALHLITHRAGHSTISACTAGIANQFLDRLSTRDLDLSCLAKEQIEPFITPQKVKVGAL